MEDIKETITTEEPDYVAAIAELKQNSVSKDKYDKLRDENNRLLNSLINGEQIEAPITDKPDIQQLRNELFKEDNGLNNLQYIEKALQLRNALMEKGEPDPFLPVSHHAAPTNEEIATAEKVATIYRECLEYADGDNAVFTNELMRRTVDVMPMKGRK